MKKILVGLAFTMFCFMLYEVKAGPPEGTQAKMMIAVSGYMFDSRCKPTMISVLSWAHFEYDYDILTLHDTFDGDARWIPEV